MSRPLSSLFCLWSLLSLPLGSVIAADDFPLFTVPGHEAELQSLNELHRLHHPGSFITCTLWDAWLPQSSLWASAERRTQYRDALLGKRIDAEGYVSMQQHRGMAHSNGWPFPAWQQSTGSGWHFSVTGDEWATQQLGLKPLVPPGDFAIDGAAPRPAADPVRGCTVQQFPMG